MCIRYVYMYIYIIKFPLWLLKVYNHLKRLISRLIWKFTRCINPRWRTSNVENISALFPKIWFPSNMCSFPTFLLWLDLCCSRRRWRLSCFIYISSSFPVLRLQKKIPVCGIQAAHEMKTAWWGGRGMLQYPYSDY